MASLTCLQGLLGAGSPGTLLAPSRNPCLVMIPHVHFCTLQPEPCQLATFQTFHVCYVDLVSWYCSMWHLHLVKQIYNLIQIGDQAIWTKSPFC